MEEAIETIEYKKYTINIYQDGSPESPDEWGDNNVFLVSYHSDFTVERDDIITKDEASAILSGDYSEYDKQNCKAIEKKYHIFGLEAYIHSGISLSISYEGNYPDRRWDVSQLGVVLVSKDETKLRKKAKEMAEILIKNWNMYLSGDIYGYIVEETDDSCWGHYGKEGKEDMVEEAKEIIDYDIEKHPDRISQKNYTNINLGELLSSNDETIKRNAISILKQLQRISA